MVIQLLGTIHQLFRPEAGLQIHLFDEVKEVVVVPLAVLKALVGIGGHDDWFLLFTSHALERGVPDVHIARPEFCLGFNGARGIFHPIVADFGKSLDHRVEFFCASGGYLALFAGLQIGSESFPAVLSYFREVLGKLLRVAKDVLQHWIGVVFTGHLPAQSSSLVFG